MSVNWLFSSFVQISNRRAGHFVLCHVYMTLCTRLTDHYCVRISLCNLIHLHVYYVILLLVIMLSTYSTCPGHHVRIHYNLTQCANTPRDDTLFYINGHDICTTRRFGLTARLFWTFTIHRCRSRNDQWPENERCCC